VSEGGVGLESDTLGRILDGILAPVARGFDGPVFQIEVVARRGRIEPGAARQKPLQPQGEIQGYPVQLTRIEVLIGVAVVHWQECGIRQEPKE
jgi:hypothetical protein